jgi:hypothetical protein
MGHVTKKVYLKVIIELDMNNHLHVMSIELINLHQHVGERGESGLISMSLNIVMSSRTFLHRWRCEVG